MAAAPHARLRLSPADSQPQRGVVLIDEDSDPVPLQHSAWREEKGGRFSLEDGDAELKIRFCSVSSTRSNEPLPSHVKSSWSVKIVNAAAGVAIGICAGSYKAWNSACTWKPNAWVLTSEDIAPAVADLERCRSMRMPNNTTIHLVFDPAAGRLTFRGDFPTPEAVQVIQPLGGIVGKELYPVIGGFSRAEAHVLFSESTMSKQADPLPSMGSYIATLLQDTQDADVVLSVGDEEVFAHSILLKRIPYFQRMLSGGFVESRKRKFGEGQGGDGGRYSVKVEGGSVNTVRQLLHFIYTDDAKSVLGELDNGDIIALARLAHMYGLSELFEAVCQLIKSRLKEDATISDEYFIDALEFARQHECLSLFKFLLSLVGQRFEALALTDRFKALPQTNVDLYTEVIKEVARNFKK